MGMRVTKQNWTAGVAFLSADPEAVDHEIALVRGRPEGGDPHLINQISMRVATLDDLGIFRRRLVAEGRHVPVGGTMTAESATLELTPLT